MSLLLALPSFLGVFLVSWWLTGRSRRYAVARRVPDVPSARSSHSVAMPRGAGVAIVIATLVALPVLGALGAPAWPLVWGLLGGGGLVGLIGYAPLVWVAAWLRAGE